MKYLLILAPLLMNPLFGASKDASKTVAINTQKSVIRWVGKKVTGQHHGIIKLKSGSVEVNEHLPTKGHFIVDMKTIEDQDLTDPSYKAKLENHLRSADFFHVEKFPEAKFEITKVSGPANKMKVDGKLTIKNITHPISFTGKVDESNGKKRFTAKTSFDRSKWDVRYNSKKFFDPAKLGDKLIYDNIDVELEIYAL